MKVKNNDWYNSKNILGWSREEFIDFICEMANLKIVNNIALEPFESKIYTEYSVDWRKRR